MPNTTQPAPIRKLIATIGLPGAGKTTWALNEIAKDPTGLTCRANRDALRIAHAGRRLGTGKQEAVVTDAQMAMIRSAFENGYNVVIVDDTNLNGVGRLQTLARDLGVTFAVKDFRASVTVETCIRRDSARQDKEPVGRTVIERMHTKSILPWLRARAAEHARTAAHA